MNAVGQALPPGVYFRQWKSPPKLSSDSMKLPSALTCWTMETCPPNWAYADDGPHQAIAPTDGVLLTMPAGAHNPQSTAFPVPSQEGLPTPAAVNRYAT